MSHEHRRPYGGGQRKKHYRDDYHEHRREPFETPEQKLRTAIIKLGEVDPIEEIPRLVKQIREHKPPNVPTVSEGFRIGVTEQPYKIPYYAAVLRLLHDPDGDVDDSDAPSLGKQVLEDYWKGFQAFLDKLAWREMRLCIHFFAHLTVAKVISPSSMLGLLQSFVSVLEEFGVSHGRAKRATLCVADGLMRAGRVLKHHSPKEVTEMIDNLQNYTDTTSGAKSLVQPIVKLYGQQDVIDGASEILDSAIIPLRALDASDFGDISNSISQPYSTFIDLDPAISVPFDLPSVLLPPEIIELDTLVGHPGEEAPVERKEEWPEYYLRLFDNEVTPDPTTPTGYAVRSALLDIIDIFEVNRKECARILLELPKWCLPGTFKPKPGAPTDESAPVTSGKDWQLESCIMEAVLSSLFVLPDPTHKSIYHIALITELCKLSPSTVGPAVGKSIRKLYGLLADGLEVEIGRRFAEWFAIHMSNFGFQWVWKEWILDLSLTIQHPKRCFIRRALEFEIRLSYYDRILKSLPEQLQAEESRSMPEHAPGPDFAYDDPTVPHHDAAQHLLNLLRGRSKADEVIAHLETLKNNISEASDGDASVDSIVRSITVQSLLHIGSRSFSHFLNAVERYLPLLRALATGPEAKYDILTAASEFWKRNRQMVAIVFDKLMQYQIVDPSDVITWTFSVHRSDEITSLNAFEWDLLRAALDKANGRVAISRRRVATLRKEEDDTRARAKASGGDTMEVDVEAKPEDVDDTPAVDSPALMTALKAFASLTREQRAALSRALDGFVTTLRPSKDVVTENAWFNRANWGEAEWNSWETWGWYRHFCRAYAPYLRNYATALSTVSFTKIEGTDDEATVLLKRIWNIAVGQES